MKKAIITIMLIITMLAASVPAYAGTSDYELAKEWKAKHCPKAHIEKVITKAQGGKKGKVCGTRYTVKYPKKVKKGKKVTVYMIEKGGDVKAMVCMGKVK